MWKGISKLCFFHRSKPEKIHNFFSRFSALFISWSTLQICCIHIIIFLCCRFINMWRRNICLSYKPLFFSKILNTKGTIAAFYNIFFALFTLKKIRFYFIMQYSFFLGLLTKHCKFWFIFVPPKCFICGFLYLNMK